MLFGSPTPSIEGTGGQPVLTNGPVETRYAGPRRPPDGQDHQGALRMITDRQMARIQRQTSAAGTATGVTYEELQQELAEEVQVCELLLDE